MKKKGLIVKVVVLTLLLVIILGEVYLVLGPRKTNNSNNDTKIDSINNSIYNIDKENLKYIVDATTSYTKNGLNYKLEKNDNKYYILIDGLKDKKLENQINDNIKKKVDESAKDSKYLVYNKIEASFSNVLSVTIVENQYGNSDYSDEEFINGNVGGYAINSYNIDLNTGNVLEMEDVIYDINSLKEILRKKAYDLATEDAGFFCTGGPCENPYPDYSQVEDFVFKIMAKFNKKDYKFYFDARYIYLMFDNLDSKAPLSIDTADINKDNCSLFTKDSKSGCVYIEECYDDLNNYKSCSKVYIDLDNKRNNATFMIDMVDLVDNVIIYDKFVNDNDLYNNDKVQIERKFIKDNMESNIIKEEDNTLIDYDADIYEEKVELVTKDLVLKEMQELQTDNYNIYSVNGSFYNFSKYSYVYYNVYHYDLKKEEYVNNKKNIYINKFSKREDIISGPSTYIGEYNFLKEYNNKKRLYFYIIESSTGKEYNSIDIIKKDFDLKKYIPSEWLNLGKYKTVDDLINGIFITYDNVYTDKNRLILDINYNTVVLRYNDKKVYLCKDDYNKRDELVKEMFGE